jgi:micrococcal nuclease
MEFTYHAEVLRVIDGDTIEVKLDLGFHIYKVARIRVHGINTPEIRGPEKEKGLLVKAFVEALLDHKKVKIISVKESDKYGRVLARIEYEDDKDLGSVLLEHGMAEVYPKKMKAFRWRRKIA